ncbi:MAG TPA: hypothetical protein PLQ44_02500 [Candidatus Paceibacterota bacterium]|nr:hypothetical protein [Candidatus Paceibacterota bacterium]
MEKNTNTIFTAVSNDAQKRLLQIMNDSPSIVKLNETEEWKITALKPAVKWRIAEVARKIKESNSDTESVLMEMANSMPLLAEVLTLALLNDKDRIESDEFKQIYEMLMWETDDKNWGNLFLEVLGLLDVDFFFTNIELVQIFQKMTTERKLKMEEQRQLLQGQNGDK